MQCLPERMGEGDSNSVNQQLYLGIKLEGGIFDIMGAGVSLNFCIVFLHIHKVSNRHFWMG